MDKKNTVNKKAKVLRFISSVIYNSEALGIENKKLN